jgi:2-hydroxychromene-2-carboxylate isomerase
MAMRGQPLPRAKQFYILRDAAREADRLGLPFGKIYDPLGEGVWRCLCIAELALERDQLAGFVIGAATAIWGHGIDVRRDALLRPICERSGLDWASCLDAIDNAGYRQRIEHNTESLAALGHWGVPTFAFQDALYWGQDRIEDLERALSNAGLLHRNEATA